MSSIHSTALVSTAAAVGRDCSIGPFTIIHANVRLGDRVAVGSHCELGVPARLGDGSPLVIGDDANIRSHSVFYESSTFGAGLVTGHHVAVREMTRAGAGLQIGSASDIQGHCAIGAYVRTHRGVHIGQHSEIGNYVWMFPDVLLTNDPNPPSEALQGAQVGDFCVLAAKSTLLPGVKLGANVFVAAHSLVGIDVPAGSLAAGNPAKILGPASMIRMKSDVRVKAYPWYLRFKRGYPSEIVQTWPQE